MEEGNKIEMPEIKICGITTEKECLWLSEEQVEYAGFVIWEKSKRYISIEQAKGIFDKLNSDIKKVAVTVSPDAKLVREIANAGFDILQVHGTLTEEAAETAQIPVWRAVNISGMEELEQVKTLFEEADFPGKGKITAVLADAKEYGSGKTFGWEDFSHGERQEPLKKEAQETPERKEQYGKYKELRQLLREQDIRFILAGGLTIENVQKGIRIFAPDIVDVSSGVERDLADLKGTPGKDEEKIRKFVKQVRNRN